MKIVQTLIVLFCITTDISAAQPTRGYSARTNIFGGYNYYNKHGNNLGSDRPNTFGGRTYYNNRYQPYLYIIPNSNGLMGRYTERP